MAASTARRNSSAAFRARFSLSRIFCEVVDRASTCSPNRVCCTSWSRMPLNSTSGGSCWYCCGRRWRRTSMWPRVISVPLTVATTVLASGASWAVARPGNDRMKAVAAIDIADLKVISLPLSMPRFFRDVDSLKPAPYIAIVGEAETFCPSMAGRRHGQAHPLTQTRQSCARRRFECLDWDPSRRRFSAR